jgi:hypothetical protein
MTTQLHDGTHEAESNRRPPRVSTKRVQIAQLLAFVALVASLVGALGPAEDVRSRYSWPPAALPAGTPSRAWYTPLLLILHRPEALSATVPCALPPPLPDAERPLTVLATARFPERTGGLSLTHERGGLAVRVGGDLLQQVSLPARGGGGSECAYRLELGGDRWQLAGPGEAIRGGTLEAMPVVTGLFSGLDLRAGTPPAVDVTTAVHGSEPLLRQSVAWTLTALCALAALALVAFDRGPRTGRALRRAPRAAAGSAHPADGLVAIVLLGWWVLSPAFADDGFIIARERMFSASGGFSHYYVSFGANLPNDYWLEWVQHWIVESPLLVLRVPALLCLTATWVLCRWILSRVLRSCASESGAALWALASVFLVGALAWGMTMRPEPLTALFVTAVLACSVRFLEKRSAMPLAVAALLMPLALTAHHSAVPAFAPLLVIAPAIVRWARARIPAAATIAAASIALLAVLLTVGADLEQRRADAEIAPQFQATSGRDEIWRYVLLLNVPPYSTPLRRASVGLIALAVLAFLLRRGRARESLLDLPAASLGLGLLVFIATPTKHVWHFGALLGVAGLAAATETARLRREAAQSGGRPIRPLVVVGAAALVSAWSWFPRHPWNEVDLRTLEWTLGFERSFSLSTLAVALPVLLLVAFVLFHVARGQRTRAGDAPWRTASWTAPLLATPLLLFTIGVFAADAAKTDSWTLARQNLGALRGDSGCGLADDLRVPRTDSVRALAAARAGDVGRAPDWVPPAPVEGVPRFDLGPAGARRPAASPWFRLPPRGSFGIFVSGEPSASDRLALEWGRLRERRVGIVATDEIPDEFASEVNAVLAWRFVAASELPARAPGANVVRISLQSEILTGSTLATTAPVTYASATLAQRLAGSRSPTLVMPSLLTFFPCARLPVLRGGAVEPPGEIVVPRWATSLLQLRGSPFRGVLDLYEFERLPLADSPNPPREVLVFGVERRIPGALEAPPSRRRA